MLAPQPNSVILVQACAFQLYGDALYVARVEAYVPRNLLPWDTLGENAVMWLPNLQALQASLILFAPTDATVKMSSRA